MQVSIYLNDQLVHILDQKAKKKSQSRSQLIQSVLEKEFSGKGKSIFDEVFGLFTPSESTRLLKSIQKSRKNSKRFA